jgi:hypothetical protein
MVHRREASFGGGRMSEAASASRFLWDYASSSFIKGHKGEVLMGSWSNKQYPCDPVLAAQILALCADEVVQKRFLTNYYARSDDSELYCCGDSLVVFHCHKALEGQGMGYYRLAACSFEFYAPDHTAQHVHLSFELCKSLVEVLKGMSPEQILEKITTGLVTVHAAETPRVCASNNCTKIVSDPKSKYCDDCLASVEEDAGWQMHINGFE